MANEVIRPARLAVDERGIPVSLDYGDVYFSADGGLAETHHVFLQGNGLPDRWSDVDSFVIGETGFGTGLNMLAATQLFLQTAPAHARLHLVSVEKHPIPRATLAALYPPEHPLAALARELLEGYPDLIPGPHRIELAQGRVQLTLCLGDALEMLPKIRARVDAWFLDGFSPAKNPSMWQPALFETIARLSAPGASLATFTCARMVRDGLAAAGFALEKRPGFGRKREMLHGYLKQSPPTTSPPPWFPRGSSASSREITIIGAGVAGASVARRLAERGWAVTVLERHSEPALEASGNPAGILHPVISAEWNALSQLTGLGLGYTRRMLERLMTSHPEIDWHPSGVLRLERSAQHGERQRKIAEKLRLPTDYARWITPEEGSELLGARVEQPGWWFAGGGWVHPPGLVRALLDHPRIHLKCHADVTTIRHEDGAWRVSDKHNRVLSYTPTLLLANAYAVNAFVPDALPLTPVRGQISLAPEQAGRSLRAVACREGYVIPARQGLHCFGASFNHGIEDSQERLEDHQDNTKRLQAILPAWDLEEPHKLRGRVSHRCATPDRLPIAGPLHDRKAFRRDFEGLHLGWAEQHFPLARLHPGLWVSTGHGARGLVWTALLAEFIASALHDDPCPLTDDLVQALHPARFDYRAMRTAPGHRKAWMIPRSEA